MTGYIIEFLAQFPLYGVKSNLGLFKKDDLSGSYGQNFSTKLRSD